MRATCPRCGRWPAAALLLAAAGCATGRSSTVVRDVSTVSVQTGDGSTWEVRRGPDVRANQRVEVTPDRAWAALPGVYAALGLEPDVRDEGNSRLGVSQHRFSRRILGRPASDFFDCGLDPGLNRPTADQVPITARVVTQVVSAQAGTELRTLVGGTARRTGGNAGLATCQSTGLMEVLIGEMVRKTAGGGG